VNIGTGIVVRCFDASEVTSKVRLPLVAFRLVEAVAVTVDELDVALTLRHVTRWPSESAAHYRAETFEVTDWYEDTAVCAVATLVLRRVCGAASTCINCLIRLVVSRPLTRPSTVLDTSACLSAEFTAQNQKRG
jgi:hypothetical protein